MTRTQHCDEKTDLIVRWIDSNRTEWLFRQFLKCNQVFEYCEPPETHKTNISHLNVTGRRQSVSGIDHVHWIATLQMVHVIVIVLFVRIALRRTVRRLQRSRLARMRAPERGDRNTRQNVVYTVRTRPVAVAAAVRTRRSGQLLMG